MTNNARTVNIYNLIRQVVREEIQKVFNPDQENTSQNESMNFSAEPTGGTQTRPRRRRRRSFAGIKGKVTKPTDKRLKANRAV